ncbi:MAG: helix-turn-helix domain-containing protein, partial [Verrucomicrobiota bacterium]
FSTAKMDNRHCQWEESISGRKGHYKSKNTIFLMNAEKPETLISLKTVASRLSLSTRAVYRLIAAGDFPRPVKVGGATRFYSSDLDAYLSRLKGQGFIASVGK